MGEIFEYKNYTAKWKCEQHCNIKL